MHTRSQFHLLAGSLRPFLPPASRAQTTPGLAGDWSGSLAAGGTTLRLVAHFAPKPDAAPAGSAFTGTLDSIDQGANGIPFSQVTLTDGAVHLESKVITALYDGKLSADGKTIVGTWSQGNGALPLTFSRTDHPPAVNRPQEPKPPFPYTVKEVTFPDAAAGVTLAGTLTEPPGAGPFPAALLIVGSGPHDRNETILGHKPFWVLADYLTRRGIAVLRYDKRGIGASTGDYKTATSADFADDAQAGVAYFEKPAGNHSHPDRLDRPQRGRLDCAHRRRPVKRCRVCRSAGGDGPARRADHPQTAGAHRQGGRGQRSGHRQTERVGDGGVCDYPAGERPGGRGEGVCGRWPPSRSPQMTPAEKKAAGDVQALVDAQLKELLSPWFRYFLAYDPIPTLKQVKCPVLALNGSKDLQVPPKEDLAAIGAALKAGGNTDYTTRELPGLNHLFQTAGTGSPSEYAKIDETFSPVALTVIGDWIAAHTAKK